MTMAIGAGKNYAEEPYLGSFNQNVTTYPFGGTLLGITPKSSGGTSSIQMPSGG